MHASRDEAEVSGACLAGQAGDDVVEQMGDRVLGAMAAICRGSMQEVRCPCQSLFSGDCRRCWCRMVFVERILEAGMERLHFVLIQSWVVMMCNLGVCSVSRVRRRCPLQQRYLATLGYKCNNVIGEGCSRGKEAFGGLFLLLSGLSFLQLFVVNSRIT